MAALDTAPLHLPHVDLLHSQHDTVELGAKSTDTFNEEGISITVTQTGEGAVLSMHCLWKCTPDQAYTLITHPDNNKFLTGQKKCAYRKVLAQHRSRQKVELETVGTWKFMMFGGEIHTRLLIVEDRREHDAWQVTANRGGFAMPFFNSFQHKPLLKIAHVVPVRRDTEERTMGFELAKPGMMKEFTGLWKVSPAADGSGNADVTLRQKIRLGIPVPGGIYSVMRQITARIVMTMVKDFKKEVDRVNKVHINRSSLYAKA